MDFRLVATKEKPLPHIELTDWYGRVESLRNVANARRIDSSSIRLSSRKLSDEARIESEWSAVETNSALTERVAELKYWLDLLVKASERINLEIRMLQEEKVAVELELDAHASPTAVLSEVFTMRDSRLGSEMTYDEPDRELKNELEILENNSRMLSELNKKTWQKLTSLEQVRFKIDMEIENKTVARNLDMVQLQLDRNSANISYKPDPLRSPKVYSSYDEWLGNIKSVYQMAQNEIADTSALRQALFVCRQKARNILRAQQSRTEFSIRKRIFETQRACNELRHQQQNMKDEMEKSVMDIKKLEDSLQDKSNILKLAESRLENRSQRFGKELCMDNAHEMLCLEVNKLREIRDRLGKKIDEFNGSYNMLSEHAVKIDKDLENKQHSLLTDTKALAMRDKLKEPENTNPSAQTDRNYMLLNLDLPKTRAAA